MQANVVHGIPNAKRVIHQGDLLKVDTGAYFDGYHGDAQIKANGSASADAPNQTPASDTSR